jgi:hypothetical protein
VLYSLNTLLEVLFSEYWESNYSFDCNLRSFLTISYFSRGTKLVTTTSGLVKTIYRVEYYSGIFSTTNFPSLETFKLALINVGLLKKFEKELKIVSLELSLS